jgi:hypothetical protein
MVSNSSKEFVFSVLDAQQDMTIKYTIMCLVLLYVAMLWIIQRKLELNSLPKIIFKLFANIYIYVSIVFFPLFTIMLFRQYPAISLWTLLLQLYSVVFLIMALALTIWGWQKILNMFGIDVDLGEMSQERTLKGE